MIRYLITFRGVIKFAYYATEFDWAVRCYKDLVQMSKETELLEVTYCSDTHQIICVKVSEERINKE